MVSMIFIARAAVIDIDGGNEYMAVILNVDLDIALGADLLDDLAAGADDLADLIRDRWSC